MVRTTSAVILAAVSLSVGSTLVASAEWRYSQFDRRSGLIPSKRGFERCHMNPDSLPHAPMVLKDGRPPSPRESLLSKFLLREELEQNNHKKSQEDKSSSEYIQMLCQSNCQSAKAQDEVPGYGDVCAKWKSWPAGHLELVPVENGQGEEKGKGNGKEEKGKGDGKEKGGKGDEKEAKGKGDGKEAKGMGDGMVRKFTYVRIPGPGWNYLYRGGVYNLPAYSGGH